MRKTGRNGGCGRAEKEPPGRKAPPPSGPTRGPSPPPATIGPATWPTMSSSRRSRSMACAASTEPAGQFDLDAPWQLDAQVRVRPEAFGALLYHFGTRQLSFLKSPGLLAVVRSLGAQPSARAASTPAAIPAADFIRSAHPLHAL